MLVLVGIPVFCDTSMPGEPWPRSPDEEARQAARKRLAMSKVVSPGTYDLAVRARAYAGAVLPGDVTEASALPRIAAYSSNVNASTSM